MKHSPEKHLETLKNLRAKIDERIGGIQQKIQDEAEAKSHAYLNRLASLCREVKAANWEFVPSDMAATFEPSIRIYCRTGQDMLEILNPEILALSTLEDHGEPLNLKHHTEWFYDEHKVAGFSIYGDIEDLVELGHAAELKSSFIYETTYDAPSLRDKIAALTRQLEEAEARLEHEQCEWDNLYFGL